MESPTLPLDQIIQGDCIEVLNTFPEGCVDLIFADPPYNLQLRQELWRPNLTKVNGVNDEWDRFQDFSAYDEFSQRWLSACRRVLKDSGTIWVIGTYHNIYRLGYIMQNLGLWFLNDVIWIKTNPMPNFRGVRFTNAHETLLWASKSSKARYTFNHHAMKALNDGLQMRSDWLLPICCGAERVQENGKKAHPTQKPQALLYRVILSSSQPGDVILDPFFGTGTSGVVAKLLHRHWIGIEKEESYVRIARKRLEQVEPEVYDTRIFNLRERRRSELRLPFGSLLENGLLKPGQALYFQGSRAIEARVKADGNLILPDCEGSIHQTGRQLLGGKPCNGWQVWFYEDAHGELHPIDELRKVLRESRKKAATNE